MARATAQQTARETARPARAKLRGFGGGGAGPKVTIDARTAYDFLVSLEVSEGADTELLPEDLQWLKRSHAALDGAATDALSTLYGDDGSPNLFHGLVAMLVDDPSIRTASDVVEATRAVGARTLARNVLRSCVGDSVGESSIESALDGDASAGDDLAPLSMDWSAEKVNAFLGRYAREYDSLITALAAWLPLFQQVEGRVRGYQERDIELRRADVRTLAPDELIERTTGGVRWIPDRPGRRIILSPSYFCRPYNYIYQDATWRLFAYPVADAALEPTDGNTPPPATVRLFRTLGDPTRLRTLKLLSERDWYLTELATELELSKPTMKHHLAQMRAAGLVTIIEEGTLTYYSLRRERLADAGLELTRFIG
jgi:DNA-binding transcriptional ArsR family regulator